MIYLPDDPTPVPLAKRCPDPQEPNGICRHADTCNAARQDFQQTHGQATGRKCPWWTTVAWAKACEPEGA